MPFQYANEANPRAHYEGTGAEIAEALDRVDVLVAGLGTGGTLMGAGERVRETFPDVVVAAAEPLPGRPGDGPPLARGRLRAADPRRLEARPEAARLERGVARRRARARRPARRSSPASRPARSSTSPARLAEELDEGVVVCILADGGWKYLSADFWDARRPRRGDGARPLVVVPRRAAPGARGARRRRGARTRPAACSRSATASRSATSPASTPPPARTGSTCASPDPALIFELEDEGYELAVFHSHPTGSAKPSRTDIANIGLWEGRPYLILSRPTGELPRGRSRRERPSRSRSMSPQARRCRDGYVTVKKPNIELSCGRQ